MQDFLSQELPAEIWAITPPLGSLFLLTKLVSYLNN
jgi:hypothetical protein